MAHEDISGSSNRVWANSPLRGLIFDFDGLILDTELPAFQSWQALYREHGCDLPFHIWATRIGNPAAPFNPLDYLEVQLGRPVDREGLRRQYRERCDELIRRNAVLPGVESYLSDARRMGLKRGVASNSARSWVVGHLVRLGLHDSFDAIRCGDEVARPKPEPDLYHAALKGLGVRAEEAVALEDSPNGVLAAKRAGVFCVAVPNALTSALSLDQADMRLSSLADLPLPELLRQMRDR